MLSNILFLLHWRWDGAVICNHSHGRCGLCRQVCHNHSADHEECKNSHRDAADRCALSSGLASKLHGFLLLNRALASKELDLVIHC